MHLTGKMSENLQQSEPYQNLKRLADKDGMIPVQLNDNVIRERVSSGIYANMESGIRELYANEMKAAMVAREEYGADPRIEITIDETSQSLVIEGIDSLGITNKIFENDLRVLGNSSNTDRSKPGMFGMGFSAYTCISDVITVYTHARETKEKMGFMGLGGVGFEPINDPNMEHFGTRVQLTFEKGKYDKVVRYASTVSQLSPIQTIIKCTDFNANTSETRQGGPDIKDWMPGNYKIVPYEPERYWFLNHNENQGIMFHSEKDGVEAYIFIDHPSNRIGACHETYLANIPIGAFHQDDYHNEYRWIVNIKDEGKYPPTPDRERFTEQAVKEINVKLEIIWDEFFSLFGKFGKFENSNNWVDWHKMKNIVFRKMDDLENSNETFYYKLAHNRYRDYDTNENLTIYDIIGNYSREYIIINMDRFTSSQIESIRQHIDSTPITPPYTQRKIFFLKNHCQFSDGIIDQSIDGKKYIKTHNLKPVKIEKDIKNTPKFLNLYNGRADCKTRYYFNNLPKDIIQLPEEYDEMRSSMLECYCFISPKTADKYNIKSLTIDDVVEKVSNLILYTSDGRMTMDGVKKSTKKIKFIDLGNFYKFFEYMKSDDTLYVAGPAINDCLTLHLLAAKKLGIEFEVLSKFTDSRKTLFKELLGKDFEIYSDFMASKGRYINMIRETDLPRLAYLLKMSSRMPNLVNVMFHIGPYSSDFTNKNMASNMKIIHEFDQSYTPLKLQELGYGMED